MLTRRTFLAAGAAAAGTLAWPAAEPAASKPARMSPAAALAELRAGNARYVAGTSQYGAAPHRRELAAGQHPFAMILGCSDSRVAPESVFDRGAGDFFVVRVAGNFADADGIGSFEYAVSHFSSPLLVVLGHSGCGAVHATVDTLKAGKSAESVPGKIAGIVNAISPAARSVLDAPGDLYANAIAANVKANVATLRTQGEIIAPAVRSGALVVAGAVYDLHSGSVRWL